MENYQRILVVDDEEDLCEILQFNLENAGFMVDVAYSAEEAMKLDLSSYQLFLLDVMMGEISGFKLAAHIRKTDQDTPIIFITAKDTETDKLTGFSIGADDYISKPFSINEVVARVRAVLKRSPAAQRQLQDQQAGILSFKDLRVNPVDKTASIAGNKLKLTKKEFELLQIFLSKPDTAFTREQLIQTVWNDESEVSDRTVDVNITRLRRKIVPYDKNLRTRQGFGYCFDTSD